MLNLNFYDNGFFRKLLSPATTTEEEAWQEFCVHEIQRHTPYANLFTPFCFLEMVGVPQLNSPRLPDVFSLIEAAKKADRGHVVTEAFNRLYEIAILHYRNLPELDEGELIAKANIRRNAKLSKEKWMRELADDTFQRFKAKPNFLDEIHQSLAINALQHYLDRANTKDSTITLQMSLLVRILEMNREGYNLAFFRLLRAIWGSVEPKLLKAGEKGRFPLKSKGDMLDTEVIHFGLCGLVDGSSEDALPVRVFTTDPRIRVSNRLKMAKWLLELFQTEILNSAQLPYPVNFPALSPGTVIVLNRDHPTIEATIKVDKLDGEIEEENI